jgi:predicted Zn-dependent peptidase
MAPEHVDEYVDEVMRLLRAHAEAIDPLHLERARNQLAVRSLGAEERPFRRIEEAVQDLFVHGRVRPRAELMAQLRAVSAEQASAAFERMLKARPAIAMAGRVRRPTEERLKVLVS